MNNSKTPIILCILDGWGHTDNHQNNAIYEANAPYLEELYKKPQSLLETSGLAVGLPDGQMGNSEVGHTSIGSGRIIMQSLPLIDSAIKDGSLEQSDEIQKQIKLLSKHSKTCHIAGLFSDGGVHSHQNHIIALIDIMAKHNIKVSIHAFLDGRDTQPKSALNFIELLERHIANMNNVQIATVSGRYYSMDRDSRWDRTKKAYDAIISAKGQKYNTAKEAIESSYSKDITDEFIVPCVIGDYTGVDDLDGFIMANFRADRARQILNSIFDPNFNEFARDELANIAYGIGMTEYSSSINQFIDTIFKPQELKNSLGQVIADNNMAQLRIAETEKYGHVTFFFNGGQEEVFKGEERILVPSPDVATYDLKPQMSAYEVTDKLISAIASDKFDLVVVNYANTDMVGHTGDKQAAIKAVEAVSECVEKLVKAVEKSNGKILITADHGNAEQMVDNDGKTPHTSHTTNPVPFIIAGNDTQNIKLKNGRLCDIAPTILQLMDIKIPKEMSGESLIEQF